MLREIKLELFKMTRRLRSYLGFGWMLLISTLFAYGMKSSPHPADMLGASIPRDFEMVGSILNSEFLAYVLMRGSLVTFVPMFICLVTGDMVAGETADGTIRPLLVRPVRRSRLLTAKFIAAALYSVLLTVFLGISALTVGTFFFGHGDLLTVENGIAIFPMGEAIWRVLAAYAFSGLGMLAVGMLAFFLSTLVGNSLASLGGAMMTMYALIILSTIKYFEPVSQYFFTTHMDVWQKLYVAPQIPWHDVAVSAAYLLTYVVVFFALAMVVFTRKDVLA